MITERRKVTNAEKERGKQRDMIPLYKPSLKWGEVFTVPKGDYATKLRDFIRVKFGRKHVLFTAGGRDAIYRALKLIGMTKKDEIIVPGYACQPIRVAIEPVCKPVYADIDEQTLVLDPDQIEKHITKNTKAIFAVHLHGNPCKIKEIVDIAKEHNLVVIEDTVQTLGGKYNGKILGSFGDFAIFSFGFAKDVGCYQGGALLANRELNFDLKPASSSKIYFKVITNIFALNQLNRIPGLVYSPLVRHWITPSFDKDACVFEVSNEALNNYQCYLLYQQFQRMEEGIEKRRENAAYYSERLEDVVTTPVETEGGKHTFYRYVIQVDRRDEFYRYLLNHGIGANIVAESLLGSNDNCPHSARACERHLMIPVHSELTQDDMEKVVKAIYAFKQSS